MPSWKYFHWTNHPCSLPAYSRTWEEWRIEEWSEVHPDLDLNVVHKHTNKQIQRAFQDNGHVNTIEPKKVNMWKTVLEDHNLTRPEDEPTFRQLYLNSTYQPDQVSHYVITIIPEVVSSKHGVPPSSGCEEGSCGGEKQGDQTSSTPASALPRPWSALTQPCCFRMGKTLLLLLLTIFLTWIQATVPPFPFQLPQRFLIR